MTEHVGRTQSLEDLVDAARARAMHATLMRPGPAPDSGDPLPPYWYHACFWDLTATDRLAHDGHQPVGQGLIPDLKLPQRMWAGGRITFHAPIRIGSTARKISTLTGVTPKTGRSGPLAFVTLDHEISQGDTLCVTERQDIVYRHPPKAPPPPPVARTDAESSQDWRFPTSLLFRYSALTFNAHRIHYDMEFCTEERHAGIVVHGPLQAQLLMHMASDQLGPLKSFEFRATAPLYHHEAARLCRKGQDLWVCGPEGRLCMEARAEI